MADTITLTAPVAYQVIQRDGSDQATITVTGTYTGADPSSIEVQFDGGGWETLGGEVIGSSAFSGTMATQPASQGTFEVRDAGNVGVTDTAAYVGIGDIFACIGQSNTKGNLTNNQTYTHATLKASFFPRAEVAAGLTWAELTDPTGYTYVDGVRHTAGSVWPLLATRVMAETGFPVAFINLGESGTGLTNGPWAYPSGGQYAIAVDVIGRAAPGGIKALLWYQGERDINLAAATSDYKTALSAMLDGFQTDLPSATSLKMVVGQTGYNAASSTAHGGLVTRGDVDAIRTAQSESWSDDADILEGPVGFDIDLSDEDGDSLHYKTDTEGLTLANRWWRCLHHHFFSGTDGLAPKFVSAALDTNNLNAVNVTLTFTGTMSNITQLGWRIVDDWGTRNITDITLTGSVVQLVADGPLNGTVYVSWGSYNDAAGSVAGDSGTYLFPLVPFIDEELTAPVAYSTRTINDQLYKEDLTFWTSASVTYELVTQPVVTNEGTVDAAVVTATSDATDARYSVTLVAPSSGAYIYRVIKPNGRTYYISVSSGEPTTLATLLAAQTSSLSADALSELLTEYGPQIDVIEADLASHILTGSHTALAVDGSATIGYDLDVANFLNIVSKVESERWFTAANTYGYQIRDSGGTQRYGLRLNDSDEFALSNSAATLTTIYSGGGIDFVVSGGPTAMQITAAQAVSFSGNVDMDGVLDVVGKVESDNRFLTANDGGYFVRDTGAVQRSVININGTDDLIIGAPAIGGTIIYSADTMTLTGGGTTAAIEINATQDVSISNGSLTVSENITAAALPTSDPVVAGRFWNDSGTVKVSAG